MWVSDEVWLQVVRKAAEKALEEGRSVSASEWVRRALERALQEEIDEVT